MSTFSPPPLLYSAAALAFYLKDAYEYDLHEQGPPVDVDKIAELLGLIVNEEPQRHAEDREAVATITLANEEAARIWINPAENSYAPRRRFTLAHEIAHFCMHRSNNRTTIIDTRKTMNWIASFWDHSESQANTFAAELLIPTGLLASVGHSIIDRYKQENEVTTMPIPMFVQQMASRFNVTNVTMDYRLKRIGVIGRQSFRVPTA